MPTLCTSDSLAACLKNSRSLPITQHRRSRMTGLKTQGRENRQDAIRFCTHCGVVTDDASQRVCPLCGLGVVLSCERAAAPRPHAAFLVVTSDLRVSAASAAAEELFEDPVGARLLELLRGD